MSIYCYDIDGTICHTEGGDYAMATPIPHMIDEVNRRYAEGHRIVFHTARGTVTGTDWRELTERQLRDWGLHYHELRFGKPYADCYVDDKAERPQTYGAIIQARMDSTRLPGKVLMDIGGKPLLAHVVEAARAAVGMVYLVFPPCDLELAVFADEYQVPQSLDPAPRDVLGSYYQCARRYGIDHIVRLTGDNPLIAPEMIKRLVRFYNDGGYDWAANCRLKVTYPVGNDAEVFSFRTLERAWREASEPFEREHVTPYLYDHPDLFKLGVMENDRDESHLRWTVDTAEDLERVRAIYEQRRNACLTQG